MECKKGNCRGKRAAIYIVLLVFDFLFTVLCGYLEALVSFSSDVLTGNVFWALFIYVACYSVLLVISMALFKTYRMIVTNFGINDAIRVAVIVFVVSLLSYCVMLMVPDSVLPNIHPAVWFMGTLALIVMCGGSRVAKRVFDIAHNSVLKANMATKRTMVVGAGAAGKIVIDDSRNNLDSKSNIVVVIDDNSSKIGRVFDNLPVVGPVSNIAGFVKKYNIDEVIIAIQSLDEAKLHQIISYLSNSNVEIRRLPILSELNSVNSKTILSVNINEILGRPVVQLDNSEIVSMLQGKTVLITGAGGSIGSELARQIYNAKPKTIILFDIYENGVYGIQQEIVRRIEKENNRKTKLVTLIGSTYNGIRMEQVIRKYKPDYIYHAAAYKHVPLMEESPVEAVRTNVLGTYNVAKLAMKYGVKKLLLVSTDKAVRPTNAMGATKRFAEMIVQYFASISNATKYCAVRFGNVLGSNGSVIPLFQKQIEAGGPVTVTDPNIIRFFMTIPEAVGLILQSSIYADGGEIFILDMGKPVKILTLAEKMIRQAGYVPYKDMNIVITGLRPGEKLYEETLYDPSLQAKTSNNKIFIEKHSKIQPIEDDIKVISEAFGLDKTPNDVKDLIMSVVKTYSPQKDD
jgi:FlaA1/EpsC-like NDP-sugar epimerase